MLFKPNKIIILGAGPAGLLAAHAAQHALPKAQVLIMSMPAHAYGEAAKSQLYGCQYLHQHIPGLGHSNSGGKAVQYQVLGDPEMYREKVYGHNWSGNTSADEYGPEKSHLAWDLRRVYDELWERYSPLAVPTLVNSRVMQDLVGHKDRRTAIISSIPARTVCVNNDHEFKTQDIWALGTAPGNVLPYKAPDMTVQCSGQRDRAWYRAATVFGYSTVEWPLAKKPPIANVAGVRKPLSTDCDCWLEQGVRRIGRYGKWQKGVLVHTAYNEVEEYLS